ncbi:MAG: DUF4430 domain-containing protein [Halobacteriota archaeon]|nr:DUF4430 domain-containing protein [Halobacteriota archaeon]
MKSRAFILVALLILTATCGCTDQPLETSTTIIITKDFGKDQIFSGAADGSDAMDALNGVADVDEDGGFIDAINDHHSEYPEIKNDWFFYVNGISADVGANDYAIHDGDLLHFDLHGWELHMRIPAIIGDFPEPFLHGYRGSVQESIIVYDEGFEDDASSLKEKMEDLGIDVSSEEVISDADLGRYNLILIGRPGFEPISRLNDIYKRLGFYVYFEDGEMVVLNSKGEIDGRYKDGAVIQATQNPWNPKGTSACENVVWMICGEEERIREGIDALTKDQDSIRYSFAVVIIEDGILKVPAS